jgi:hypothetical protein
MACQSGLQKRYRVQFLAEQRCKPDGGVIGILLGWLIKWWSGRSPRPKRRISADISLDIVLLATLFSTAVGYFSVCTRNRAALQPVDP